MTTILNGVVHGQIIELTEPANLPEGGAVRVMLLDAAPRNGAAGLFPSPPAFARAQPSCAICRICLATRKWPTSGFCIATTSELNVHPGSGNLFGIATKKAGVETNTTSTWSFRILRSRKSSIPTCMNSTRSRTSHSPGADRDSHSSRPAILRSRDKGRSSDRRGGGARVSSRCLDQHYAARCIRPD